ncbi:hypothetical protein R4P47_13585 [Rhodococcus sp. IEGM 1370]|uniref:sporulation-delaying protein SdpB family protein n=1 Tax=Rhodococcus sp. IEGM 1370 TaxID=3082222 RepID=UPI002954C189|nr:sporulation-delaying protein SdpB family protein [Rhodococcus sp. IEGM 1370]MDV8077592.1 hypothetical protein [Rhodococcus sp. IEGM 1370]
MLRLNAARNADEVSPLNAWVRNYDPRTRYLGIGRTLIALAQLSILAFTPVEALMVPVGSTVGPKCGSIQSISLYCIGGDAHLGVKHCIIGVLLLVVASGYRPRYTSIIHAWVTVSISGSITLPDGGESVARVVTLLLILVCLADNRVWHWRAPSTPAQPTLSAISLAALIFVRLQIAYLYIDSAIAKFGVDNWADGSAEYYFIRNPMFGSAGPIDTAARAITTHALPTVMLTWGALAIELIIGLAILGGTRSRRIALILDCALHAGIILTMGLWSFSLVMIGSATVAAAPHSVTRDAAIKSQGQPCRTAQQGPRSA